jgi:hypothetical protein
MRKKPTKKQREVLADISKIQKNMALELKKVKKIIMSPLDLWQDPPKS